MPTQQAFYAFYIDHPLIKRANLAEDAQCFSISNSLLNIGTVDLNSYHASVITDFVRHQLLDKGASFTFETVMSDPSKIDFMHKARARGYRTYLYFVCTENTAINLNRVKIRVADKGHDVDPEKVRERYSRCLALLPQAILATDRAYIFDNSGSESELEVEITDASTVTFRVDLVHDWCADAMDAFIDLLRSSMNSEDRKE